MTTIALITGANKGIGYETARLLGQKDITVLVGSRDEQRGEQAAENLRVTGVDAHAIELDVTDEKSVTAAAERIGNEYGKLDILVNNAGVALFDGTGKPTETTLETMRKVYETNVFGPVAVINAMLPLLRKAKSPRIVNVSSEVGSIGATTDPESPMWPLASIPYPSSKTALNMVTAMYAKELAAEGIKVNAANPGYCATDLNHNNGFRTAEQGAEVSVHLATLPDDGPTGKLWGYLWTAGSTPDSPPTYGVLPW